MMIHLVGAFSLHDLRATIFMGSQHGVDAPERKQIETERDIELVSSGVECSEHYEGWTSEVHIFRRNFIHVAMLPCCLNQKAASSKRRAARVRMLINVKCSSFSTQRRFVCVFVCLSLSCNLSHDAGAAHETRVCAPCLCPPGTNIARGSHVVLCDLGLHLGFGLDLDLR